MTTELPPPRGSWVAIQRNRLSGSGRRRHELLDLVRDLRTYGLRPRVFSRRERLADWLSQAGRRENLACIVAAGGDGTLRDVLNRYPGLRVALLPLGSENLVARYLGSPRSGRQVATMIAAGHVRKFDLGTIGEHRFAIMASAGFDADVIHRAHAERTGHISRLRYIQPICQSLRKYVYPELRVWIDDHPQAYLARSAIVVNLPAYALGLKVAEHARGDDGVFEVRLFQRGSPFQMCRYFYNLARGTHERLADVLSLRGSRIRIEAESDVPVQVDGDPAGGTPVELRILPAAFQVIVPPPALPL